MKVLFVLMLFFSLNANAQKDSIKTDTSYILKGKFPDFQLLYLAVKSPRDITPNQQDAILNWVKGIKQEIDSVKVTK